MCKERDIPGGGILQAAWLDNRGKRHLALGRKMGASQGTRSVCIPGRGSGGRPAVMEMGQGPTPGAEGWRTAPQTRLQRGVGGVLAVVALIGRGWGNWPMRAADGPARAMSPPRMWYRMVLRMGTGLRGCMMSAAGAHESDVHRDSALRCSLGHAVAYHSWDRVCENLFYIKDQANIFEWEPGFQHSRLAVFDRHFVQFGGGGRRACEANAWPGSSAVEEGGAEGCSQGCR
jgi:hypothetical protein